MNNWEIQGCSERCLMCSKEFSDGENFHCRLFLEKDGPRREDYCKDCWAKRSDIGKGYSSWQGRYKVQPVHIDEEPIKEPISKQLLKKWIHSTERLHQCFCYVLAILLERNKTFQIRPNIKGQLVYEDRDTGETYILIDPGLTIKELTQIEGQLQEMLKQELRTA